ncbi:MAG TPA: pentapeptide repeat-containing protein [Bryobacteraceae bacterium]|nr:pentapeptide repeat-containing protein [Bryobacteraceae bacterium]
MVCGKDLIRALKGGVEYWNALRHQNPDIVMLNGADLENAQLPCADLHRVFLMESDLRRANLSCANLEGAILRNADLRGSDLRHANIAGADLCRANLSGADLREASLTSTFMKRTDVRGADLSTALGLTDAQINDAFGDDRTRLPGSLARPTSWAAQGPWR